MTQPTKLPSGVALSIINGALTEELSIHHCNHAERSKAQLFEVGGPGGRQFGIVVGDMYAAQNPKPSQQTRILLEKCQIPDIPGITLCDDNYNGSRVTQSDSRLAPPNQSSCLVADETSLVDLLRWYSSRSSKALQKGLAVAVDSLERTRIEKAAQDAGFDLSVAIENEWLILRSTAFLQVVGVSARPGGSYRIGLSDAFVGHKIASELMVEMVEPSGRWATIFDEISNYKILHLLLERVAAICRAVSGDGLRKFEEESRRFPDTTESLRLVAQRVGQDIFRASLLDYWGGRCAVSGLNIPALLRASHIKPWAGCASDAERLDVFNGLLLAPHFDALFDGGWVTFSKSGQILISDELNSASRARFGISGEEVILGLTDRHQAYLAWHLEHCFRKGTSINNLLVHQSSCKTA